jgi:hypothetical protein
MRRTVAAKVAILVLVMATSSITFLFAQPTWVNIAHGTVPPLPAWWDGIMVQDGSSPDRVLLLGQRLQTPGNPPFGEIWSLDLNDFRWALAKPSEPIAERCEYGWGYDAVGKRLIVFSGYPGDYASFPQDTLVLHLDTLTWETLAVSGGLPPGRGLPASGYDSARNRLIIFGGYDDAGVRIGDTWSLDLNTNTWMQLTPSVSPSGRYHAAFTVYRDSSGNEKLFLFGGKNGGNLGDMWSFDFSTGEWTEINPSGDAIAGGPGGRALFDPLGQRILLIGLWIDVFQIDVNTWNVTHIDNDMRGVNFAEGTPGFWDATRRRAVIYENWSYYSDAGSYRLGQTWYFGEPDYVLPLKVVAVRYTQEQDYPDQFVALYEGGLGPYTVFYSDSKDFSNPVPDPNWQYDTRVVAYLDHGPASPIFYFRIQGE